MNRLFFILVIVIPLVSNAQADILIDAAKDVDEVGGGYKFAVVLLAVVIAGLSAIGVMLWLEIKQWKKDYIALSTATSSLLAEFNIKLDGQGDIKKAVDEVKNELIRGSCRYGN